MSVNRASRGRARGRGRGRESGTEPVLMNDMGWNWRVQVNSANSDDQDNTDSELRATVEFVIEQCQKCCQESVPILIGSKISPRNTITLRD